MKIKTYGLFLLMLVFLVGCSSNPEIPFKDEVLTKIEVKETKNNSKIALNQKELHEIKSYFDKISWRNGKVEMVKEPDYIMQIISQKAKKQHTRLFSVWINKDQSISFVDYENGLVGDLSKNDARDFKTFIYRR